MKEDYVLNEIALATGVTSRACATQLLGPWAIEPELFARMWGIAQANIHIVNTPQPKADGGAESDNRSVKAFKVGKVGVMPLHGPNTKEKHSFQAMFGGYSTAEARAMLRQMAADPSIGAIVLHVDSPGGAVNGTGDFADDLHAVSQVKPTFTYIEDLGASAAMWISSQTGHITASPHAMVGSIGVYTTVYDTSEQYAKAGVKAHVIKAGEVKAAGAPGVPIDDKALASIQARINDINEDFVEAVARGRKMEIAVVRKSNTGGVWMAAEAKERGLIDALGTFEDVMRLASKAAGQADLVTKVAMAKQKTEISDALAPPPSLSTLDGNVESEAAAPSEAPVQPAHHADAGDEPLAASDPAPASEPAETSTSSSDMSSVSEDNGTGAIGEQPQTELRPEESAMTNPTAQDIAALVDARVAAAMKDHEEKVKAATLTKLRAQVSEETGMSEKALAGFDEEGLAAFLAEYRAQNSEIGVLPRKGKAKVEANEEPLFDVSAEYAKQGNPEVIMGRVI